MRHKIFELNNHNNHMWEKYGIGFWGKWLNSVQVFNTSNDVN